jgi:transcriptional regulator with XRE-family HTH domain
MKPSHLRHPVAVLRQILALGQKEFAELVGCSTIAIQKIENLGLRLSERLAGRIAEETGCALAWLLAGDAAAVPTSARREVFTLSIYDRHRARKVSSGKVPVARVAVDFANVGGQLHGVLRSANRAGKYDLAAYRVRKFMDDLAVEFGEVHRDWPAVREAMLTDIAQADTWFAELGERGTGGQDVVTKKAAPTKARPRSVKRKG